MSNVAYQPDAGSPVNKIVTLIAIGLGGVMALALGFLMYTLTHSSEMKLSETARIQMLDFVRVKRNETVDRKDRKPERPQINEVPEAPPAMKRSSSDAGQTLAVSAPTNMGVDLDVGRIGIGSGDGEYLPIVKVAPVYPRRAVARGLTGTCLVRYTVTTAGTVKDVVVVEEHCTDAVFHRPSVEAALRFKYKPRVIDGAAVEVIGVHNMFHYEMAPEAR